MERIILAIREIRDVLTQIAVAEAMLDSLLFFFVIYLVCMLLGIDWRLGVVISLVFFAHHCSQKVKHINLRDVETTVPELKEQLSTSADNVHLDNEIVQLLHLDVLARMRAVKVSMFIPYKKLWREIMGIAAIAFLIIILVSLNVKFLDYKTVLSGFKAPNSKTTIDFNALEADNSTGGGGDIFGNESIAELGNRQLQLQINPILSEINLDDIKEAKPKDFDTSETPLEIKASTDSSFDENIPREHKEIVKRYFSAISGKK
ncbi:hypothetical protein HY641_04560 [Candidatus Woesearchaeota archaeon]|nr:hypothetical protein [Candidatus Woesearchaeota archaeon]